MLKVFRSKPKFVTVRSSTQQGKKEVPDNLWSRCDQCSTLIYNKELEKTLYVCPTCGFHFRVGSKQRVEMLVDEDSFRPFPGLSAGDPLAFPGYQEKLQRAQEATGLAEAVLVGYAAIEEHPLVLAIIDFGFMGGSMGSVVGEQITRSFEASREKRCPLIVLSGGGGGARMQEGMYSLMQMAKTCQAAGHHDRDGLLFISVLTHPTMGGIYASFASLGDIILAEPGALIGFAGPRIVEETTRQTLPAGFQSAEFALEHGMLDAIVNRAEMKMVLARLLKLHHRGEGQ